MAGIGFERFFTKSYVANKKMCTRNTLSRLI